MLSVNVFSTSFAIACIDRVSLQFHLAEIQLHLRVDSPASGGVSIATSSTTHSTSLI